MSGSHAQVSYVEESGAVKPTQWKGIYLEQIDYPKMHSDVAENAKELKKCLHACTAQQLMEHHKNPNPAYADKRLVVTDMDGGIMGSYSQDKCSNKITPGYSEVYYFEKGTHRKGTADEPSRGNIDRELSFQLIEHTRWP